MVSSVLFVTSLMWIRRAIKQNERRICSLPWQYPKIFTNLKSIRSCSFCHFLSFRFFNSAITYLSALSEKLSWMYHTKREHLSFLVKKLVIKSRSYSRVVNNCQGGYLPHHQHKAEGKEEKKTREWKERKKMPRLWYEAKKMKTARDVKSKMNPMIWRL